MKETINEKAEKKNLVLEVFEELSLFEKMEVLRLMWTPELQKRIEREIDARRLVEQAKSRATKHLGEGWTREDFQKQFLEAQQKISNILNREQNDNSNSSF